jgi:tetratricopeptide (TPR) repeat protein
MLVERRRRGSFSHSRGLGEQGPLPRMRTPGWVGRWALAVLSATLFTALPLKAADTDKAKAQAEESVREVELASQKLGTKVLAQKRHNPVEMIAAGELYLRTKQPEAAIDELSKVVELHRQGKASRSTDADAHYLLGEAYYQTGELYSARSHFETVTEHASDPAFAGLGGPAASRLVDIALTTHRTDTLPDVLARVERMLSRASNDALLYARAKALFALGRYADARGQAASIKGGSIYAQRASYLRGTALMREAEAGIDANSPDVKADYGAAIAAFEQATVPAEDSGEGAADARRIADLSWLAIARLHYEVRLDERAVVAYQKVERSSEYFSTALFELAWTYVRLGDYERAQRALEALTVLNPGLVDGADASLLRADLLLRAGRFADADKAYTEVRDRYEPIRAQVHAYIEAHEDPAIYYDKLTGAEIEIGNELPTLAVDWAREEAREERVFAIVDDVARSRNLVKRSRRIVTLLRAALDSPSRAKIFPEVQGQLEQVVGLHNQLALARLTLAKAMDEVAQNGGAELNSVRAKRQKLMARLASLPTKPGDFTIRASRTEKSWDEMSQTLQRLELEADHLRALVNGLERMLSEAERHGVTADEATLARFRAEIKENAEDLSLYIKRIEELREQVQVGRVQSGFGDEKFEEDDRIRAEFVKAFSQEVSLASRAGGEQGAYAKSLAPLLVKVSTLEGRLAALRGQLDSQASSRGDEVRLVVNQEAEAIESYASKLDTMDQHARLLVGEVARNNLLKARDRIKGVVMRADVGLVQQAWELREEQRYRVRDLLRERAQEERLINDELREVLDDEEGGQ